jgi:hypothetical protein
MFHEERTIYHRLFLVGVSVEVASHMFHPVEDVPSVTFLCSFEKKVFHEMRHPLFVVGFIASTGIDGKATIGHGRCVRSMDKTDSVG